MARKTAYRALVGLNYPPNGKGPQKRAEPGDVVDDLPTDAIESLIEDGSIELALATGGVISPGRAYLVGEFGPEGLTRGDE